MQTSKLATLARAGLAAAVLLFSHAVAAQTLYYIHADHLNTPRLLTDQNQAVIWRWDPTEPFGDSAGAGSVGRDGFVVTVPLRYPGQYFDKETNLHYNYFRDYDPGIGRYVQSDPIGLRGGMNSFAYVNGQPNLLTDPTGEIVVPLIVALPVIGGIIGGTIDVIHAGRCENWFKAFGRGFVSGATGTLTGMGVAAITKNPWLAGSSGAEVASLVDQSIANGSIANLDAISAAVATVTGGVGGGVLSRLLPVRGFTPSLSKPRNLLGSGTNSNRMLGQEAANDAAGGVFQSLLTGGGDSAMCGCQ